MSNLIPVYEDVQTEYQESCRWPWYRLLPVNEALQMLPPGWMERRLGHLYIAILSNGLVKIGGTRRPKQRVKQHLAAIRQFTDIDIDGVYFTAPHTNFSQNEKWIHNKLRSQWGILGRQSEVYRGLTFQGAVDLVRQCKLECLTWAKKLPQTEAA